MSPSLLIIAPEPLPVTRVVTITFRTIGIPLNLNKIPVIPFVPQTSPFLPSHPLQLPTQPPASPFSPSPPLSTSVSPTQSGTVVHEQTPVAHPLQAPLPNQPLSRSLLSLKSSPRPSPLPHTSQSPPHQAPHTDNPEAAAYFYQPHLPIEDHSVQEQLPHAQLSHQNLFTQEWASLDQTYRYAPPAPSWDLQPQPPTISNHPLQETIPRHFSSPHQVSNHHPPHPPQSTLADDLSQDQMLHTMIQRVTSPTTTMVVHNHDLNLGDSLSWNSAMTPMNMADPLHFHHPESSRVQQPLLDLSFPRQRLHLPIVPPQPSPVPQYNHDHLHHSQQLQPLHVGMVTAVRRDSNPETEYLQHYGAMYHHPRQYYLSDQEQEQEAVVPISSIHPPFPPHQQLPVAHGLQGQPLLSPHDPRYLEQIYQARFLVETNNTNNNFDFPVHHTPPLLLD